MKEPWSVSSGNGGLDTGSIEGRKTFIVHVIAKRKRWFNWFIPRQVDFLFSREEIPSLPKGYTESRRVGTIQ